MFTDKAGYAETKRIEEIMRLLRAHYPETRTALRYENPFQLFAAAVLSAQTTDEQVNRITSALFTRASTAQQMAKMEPAELATLIKGCGLYRNKSRFLVEACRRIVRDFGGTLPDRFEACRK
ncbi:MAG: hypothetical protein AB1767_01930 [Bacillota bacterium]